MLSPFFYFALAFGAVLYASTAWVFWQPRVWRLQLFGTGALMLLFATLLIGLAAFDVFVLNKAIHAGPGCAIEGFLSGDYCTTARSRSSVFISYVLAVGGLMTLVHGAFSNLAKGKNVA